MNIEHVMGGMRAQLAEDVAHVRDPSKDGAHRFLPPDMPHSVPLSVLEIAELPGGARARERAWRQLFELLPLAHEGYGDQQAAVICVSGLNTFFTHAEKYARGLAVPTLAREMMAAGLVEALTALVQARVPDGVNEDAMWPVVAYHAISVIGRTCYTDAVGRVGPVLRFRSPLASSVAKTGLLLETNARAVIRAGALPVLLRVLGGEKTYLEALMAVLALRRLADASAEVCAELERARALQVVLPTASYEHWSGLVRAEQAAGVPPYHRSLLALGLPTNEKHYQTVDPVELSRREMGERAHARVPAAVENSIAIGTAMCKHGLARAAEEIVAEGAMLRYVLRPRPGEPLLGEGSLLDPLSPPYDGAGKHSDVAHSGALLLEALCGHGGAVRALVLGGGAEGVPPLAELFAQNVWLPGAWPLDSWMAALANTLKHGGADVRARLFDSARFAAEAPPAVAAACFSSSESLRCRALEAALQLALHGPPAVCRALVRAGLCDRFLAVLEAGLDDNSRQFVRPVRAALRRSAAGKSREFRHGEQFAPMEEEDGARADELRAEGNVAFGGAEYARAHALYTRALAERFPLSRGAAVLLANRAESALRLGRLECARDDCTRALAVVDGFVLHEEEPPAHADLTLCTKLAYRRARAFAQLGRPALARTDIQLALARAPADPRFARLRDEIEISLARAAEGAAGAPSEGAGGAPPSGSPQPAQHHAETPSPNAAEATTPSPLGSRAEGGARRAAPKVREILACQTCARRAVGLKGCAKCGAVFCARPRPTRARARACTLSEHGARSGRRASPAPCLAAEPRPPTPDPPAAPPARRRLQRRVSACRLEAVRRAATRPLAAFQGAAACARRPPRRPALCAPSA